MTELKLGEVIPCEDHLQIATRGDLLRGEEQLGEIFSAAENNSGRSSLGEEQH